MEPNSIVDYKELKRYYRTELLTGGLVLGLILTGIAFLQYFTRNQGPGLLQSILAMADFAGAVAVLVVYGKRVSTKYAEAYPTMGFSYGKAFGFSLLLVMLSGVIYGMGYYLLTEVVDPGAYGELKQAVITGAMEIYEKMPNFTPEQIETSGRMLNFMFHNLLGNVIVYTLAMLFQGGFVALLTSAIVRRQPQFMQQPPHSEETPQS